MNLSQAELNKWIYTITQALVIIGIAIVAIFVASFVDKFINPSDEQEPQPIVEKSDYEKKDDMDRATILINHQNTAQNQTVSNKAIINLTVEGILAKGYLYVIADVNGHALEVTPEKYLDAVYVNLIEQTVGTQTEFGGHLVQTSSLETPQHKEHTEFLYKLSDVPYKPHFADPAESVTSSNWLEVLNRPTKKHILAFSSTERGLATIQRMVVYYECVEGTYCSVTAEQVSD